MLATEAVNRKGMQGESFQKLRFAKRIMFSRLPTVPKTINMIPHEDMILFLMSVMSKDVEDMVVMMLKFENDQI